MGTTERLAAAAIIRDGSIESRGFKSHWQIRAALGDENPQQRKRGDEEGFVTSTGRFVDRDEAQDVAVASGQIPSRQGRTLLSADIDWDAKPPKEDRPKRKKMAWRP
jgi:hypothetical protein